MAGFQYESLPTESEDGKEKSPLTTTPAQPDPDHRERTLKTVFAASIFVIVWGGVLLILSMMESEEELWSSRQALIPKSQFYKIPCSLTRTLEQDGRG